MRRPRQLSNRLSGERGLVLVFTALTMVALMMSAAVVVDLGNARQERRRVQNAVDASALAATRAYDGSGSDAAKQVAMTTALTYLRANSIEVPPTASTGTYSYPCIDDGCVAELAFPNDLMKCIEVRVRDLQAPTTFARVIDTDNVYVDAESKGCRRGLGGATSSADSPALFSKSGTCDAGKTLVINGSHVTVNGTMQSNGEILVPGSSSLFNITGVLHTHTNLTVSGSTNDFNGPVTYGGSFSSGGSGNTFDVGYPQKVTSTPVTDWPIDVSIDDYKPTGARAIAAGSSYHHTSAKLDKSWLQGIGVLVGNVLQPGLYYTTDGVDLDLAGVSIDSTAGAGGVTFVSEGQAILKWSTAGHVARPFEPSGLLLFSNYRKTSPDTHKDNCDSSALSLPDGTNFSWEGIVYAPRGQAKINGSSGTVVSGSILALALEVSGQDFTINADPDLFPAGADEAFLDE